MGEYWYRVGAVVLVLRGEEVDLVVSKEYSDSSVSMEWW